MPLMTDFSRSRGVESRHMTRVVPVILYASLPEEERATRASDAGAEGYVSKTRGVDAMIARMDELLSNEILF